MSLALLALAVGCSGDDGGPAAPATWQLLGENRPSALLGAWASSVDDAWVVGGREGSGGSPTVFHFDGTAWTKLDTGKPNLDVWQVFGFAKAERRGAAEHQRAGAADLPHQRLDAIRVDRLRLPARQAEQHGGISRVAVSGQGERAEQLDGHAVDLAGLLAQSLREPERGAHRQCCSDCPRRRRIR